MATPDAKLELLKKREAELKARIAAEEAKQKARKRKEDTRLKVVVGAAVLADAAKHPDTRAGLVAVLKRAIKAPNDIAFLKSQGWLS